jgi:hypothetical protein
MCVCMCVCMPQSLTAPRPFEISERFFRRKLRNNKCHHIYLSIRFLPQKFRVVFLPEGPSECIHVNIGRTVEKSMSASLRTIGKSYASFRHVPRSTVQLDPFVEIIGVAFSLNYTLYSDWWSVRPLSGSSDDLDVLLYVFSFVRRHTRALCFDDWT